MNFSIRSIVAAITLYLCFAPAVLSEKNSDAGKKPPISIDRGDSTLTISGKTKIEHYFEDNAHLLNKAIPDQNEFFKHVIDLDFLYAFGKKQFKHDAMQAFVGLRHKGIWGKALSYADRDAGPIGPSQVRFNKDVDAVFGSHSHTSGKLLAWFREAWLNISLNAICRSDEEKRHFIKIGWFPFQLDPRGIAFGAAYGLNKEFLGLYSYVEDKAAPGILLTGELVKDKVWYDIYYAKFEERSKSLGDTINLEKTHIVRNQTPPWRGVNKDDEAIAGRLTWKAFQSKRYGELELIPFAFYNEASDQTVEIAPDAKTEWGSYGLSAEYLNSNFECGGEFAINYGQEKLFKIDRNSPKVKNIDGNLVEEYSHILDATGRRVLVTQDSKAASIQRFFENDKQIPGTSFVNAKNRFRPAFTNKFCGWMAVADGAYNFSKWNTKLAFAYGYTSGDDNPHDIETSKNFNGFIGFHEVYSGKHVQSWFLLNRRVLMQPSISTVSGKVLNDVTFSDIQHVGFGATWTPNYRKLKLNANILAYWKSHQSFAFDMETEKVDESNLARQYLGTELNLISSIELLPGLKLFGNFAIFLPGGFYEDVQGVPLGKDIFKIIVDDPRNDADDASLFRLGHDNAYEMNIGLEYKF